MTLGLPVLLWKPFESWADDPSAQEALLLSSGLYLERARVDAHLVLVIPLMSTSFLPSFLNFFFNFFLLRERERKGEWGRGRKRGRKRIPSKLCTVSTGTYAGIGLVNHGIVT